MPHLTGDQIDRARSVPIEDVIAARGINLRGKIERVGPCPVCGGTDRFSINTKKGVFNCRGCNVGGDVIALVQHLDGTDFVGACTTLVGSPSKANGKNRGISKKVVTATYVYRDQSGSVVFVKDRVQFRKSDGTFVLKDGKPAKTFQQRRPDPDRPGGWLADVQGVPVVPYRLPELIEAIAAGHPVLIVEGETKADLLATWGVIGTCNSGGAKKWKPEHSAFLKDADVVLVPDNDDPGWQHVNLVGESLIGIAKRIRVLTLPGLGPKGDIIDWAKAGGAHEQLDLLVEQAPLWLPPKVDDNQDKAKAEATAQEDELLEALARLRPGVEFARRRAQAAKELGVPRGSIDDELEARRSNSEKLPAPLYGHWIVEPWPEVADGDALLRDIILRIRRHVVCSYDVALTAALWTMFAWVHDEAATHSPILNITSAEPECGKTTLLGLMSFLTPRCVSSVEISEAALFRAIELWQPSFAIDEFDAVLASEDKTALRSVINSGHTRGQGVVRCVEPDYKPQLFKTFCPKTIGMVGRKLPATTLGRCIILELRRRKASEPIAEKFEHKDNPELAQLRSRLLRWSMDNADILRDAKPSMPEAFDNRRADNWRVLLAIADLAGEDWGEKARQAATALEGASDITTDSVRLLADIKRIRDELKADDKQTNLDCILSAKLVEKLKVDEEGPWFAWNNGKGLTRNALATLLGGGGGRGRASRGGFGIRSDTVHPAKDVHGKGYKWTQFEDAWARYLPAENPENSSFPPGKGVNRPCKRANARGSRTSM